MRSTSGNAYPQLLAEQTDETAREMLRAVARGRGVLVVQLLAAPVVEGLHLLEVSAPGQSTERFLAEPVAAPCDLGFPLRLAPYLDAAPTSWRPSPELGTVPELAFDSLPPRRTDNPTSGASEVDELAQAGVSLGGWLMPGSGGMQAVVAREIDHAWLAELAVLEDVASFAEESVALIEPVGKLFARGDAHLLSAVITTMRTILRRDSGVGRTKFAGRVLRFMRDPSRLVSFVDAALGSEEEPTAALRHVLLETQAAAAEALCAGRLRHRDETARARFIELMRALGPAAMAGLAAALRACLARGERTGELVEDLLRAIPESADEATGAVVVELLRGGPLATTTSAALAVLPTLWGARARPFVLGALGHPDQGVVLAAIRGLRVLSAVDVLAVRRLEPIVTGIAPASEELRVAATNAIASALPEARMDAAAVASRAFDAGRHARTGASGGVQSGALTVAQAHALLSLGVPSTVIPLIEERAANSPDDIRDALMSLLRRPS